VSRGISSLDIKKLYGLSAARCNLCGVELFEPKIGEDGYVHLGEMAHQAAYSNNDKAPRPRNIDKNLPDNSYDNLILLCSNDHIRVDSDTKFYTVKKLKEMKECFEKSIRNKLGNGNFLSSNDEWLVSEINKNFNFQYLLSQLDDPIRAVPFEIGDPIDMYNFLLVPNSPSYYPL
jgi:hypothetical protein